MQKFKPEHIYPAPCLFNYLSTHIYSNVLVHLWSISEDEREVVQINAGAPHWHSGEVFCNARLLLRDKVGFLNDKFNCYNKVIP